MEQELVVASNNAGKLKEIAALIQNIKLYTLKDIGFTAEIPEPHHTFRENAHEKAITVFNFCGKNVFAEDSGICVRALQDAPGVDSAHYSGTRNDEANLQKVLLALKQTNFRYAYYKAVICLIWKGEIHYFEGVCEGKISYEKRGENGFGYDPIFIPEGHTLTFAELPAEVKNSISHRSKAVQKMIAFLNNN
jgi:XTP/dITP diphosphohydrolase